MTPHETLSELKEEREFSEKSSLSERMSSLIGSFVHNAFELSVQGETLNLDLLWKSEVESSPVFMGEALSQKAQKKIFVKTSKLFLSTNNTSQSTSS